MGPVGLYYEQWEVGQRWTTFPRTVTETDLLNFVGVTGMFERLFLDAPHMIEESVYKKRLTPAALTFAMAEGLVIQLGLIHETGVAFLGATLTTKAPVGVGDTIHVEVEVTEKRLTSKGDRGLVRSVNRVVNQDGQCVLEYDPLRLIKCRPEQP